MQRTMECLRSPAACRLLDVPQPMDEPNAPFSPDPPPPVAEARLQPAPDHAEEDLADMVDDAVPGRSYQMLPMVIPALIALLLFTSALGVLLAAVNVYFRDMQHLLELALYVVLNPVRVSIVSMDPWPTLAAPP